MTWLTGWGYRKSHVIDGSTAGQQTNYQVRVVAHKGSGADSGADVYLGANVRDDFGDVRFTGSDGQTLLDYWMESLVAGSYAVFWVEVPTIPASPGSATIYIYYGEATQTTTSNGPNTFPFFDDFSGDLSKWTIESGTWAIVAGVLRHSGAAAENTIRCNTAHPGNCVIELKERFSAVAWIAVAGIVARGAAYPDGYQFDVRPQDPTTGQRQSIWCHSHVTACTWYRLVGVNYTFLANTWYKNSGFMYGTQLRQRINDASEISAVDTHHADTQFRLRVYIAAGQYVEFDDVRIRNYCEPEPAHGAWGPEEGTVKPPLPKKIELRLSDVDPPEPDPPRTIYRDLVNLPDPTQLGINIRYFNYDNVNLYFRITGSCAGYTFGTVDLGLLGSGASAYQNLDNFASRAKPAAELTENIVLTLRAYTDAGYTNLKWTYERTVSVIWIDSSDPAYTQDVLNNFDDGTLQGWSGNNLDAGYPQAVSDYALSAPYSLGALRTISSGVKVDDLGFYKTFTTPNKSIIYAIIDLRIKTVHPTYGPWIHYLRIYRDTVILIQLGVYPAAVEAAQKVFTGKWARIVVPLPANTTFTLRIYTGWYSYYTPAPYNEARIWIDDFKIISK